ncbi:hypothetical protein ASC94_10430 [Massilia sp. Root418]|uniref:hypothetical protein n=1 Tax=Massilia sp. Root418 TaxID=1736532 RepID=UPI0006FC87E9|nr:hypothetical protein [Massilia sp. Root418]KQW97194.1 hypothetical protein ASC94_10430 [Massilia sp. Root418]
MSAGTAAGSCTLTQAGAVTDIPVGQKCSVTYIFNTKASGADNLAIPYAVALNGSVLPEYDHKPHSLTGDRKIKLKVAPGSKVALYLNSDARQGFRTHPVYAVQVGSRDVEILITERLGRGNTETAMLGLPVCIEEGNGRRFDKYEATLTGNVWMKVSHRYTREEANELMPADADPSIRAAVLSIFSPLPNPILGITFLASREKPAEAITLTFQEQQSVNANTSYCPLLQEVLPRTHPLCYLALITEARAAGITKLRVTSAWRPSFGSIVHRAGLGLDVDYIESAGAQLTIARKSISEGGQQSSANVSQDEKQLFDEMKKKQAEFKLKKEHAARCVTATAHSPGDASLAEKCSAAADEVKLAAEAAAEAKNAWKKKMQAEDPALMNSLRSRLSIRPDVHQILDPWYMDFNTQDKRPADPNEHRPGVEKAHNNHLHITIKEPRIL